MMVMTAILAVMSALMAGLAVKVAVSGPRSANDLTRRAVPDSVRHGVTGGLLTSLENVPGRWTRVALLLLAATACGFGAWLALQA